MIKVNSHFIVFSFFLSVAITMSSCNNDIPEYIPEEENDSVQFPIIMDAEHDSVTVEVDGKTITIIYGDGRGNTTRAIDNNIIYPRDPNAPLATTPILASKGEYKKYAVGAYPPFSALPSNSVVLLRLNKFTFRCVAPPNAQLFSFKITNITDQGFATENANYKGFTVDNIRSTTSAVVVNCSFYIQDGIAYNAGGQQLTGNTYYPLAGEDVQYQFTYAVD